MSILDNIATTKPGAPRITIYGRPGIGKSTLASQFPEPLFLLTEDNELPGIQALPIVHSFLDMWKNVKSLLALEELPFKTLVVDSISKLDAMVLEHTIDQSPLGKDKQPVKTIAQAFGGYGAGFEKAASLHRGLKYLFDQFKKRGITVIYISHLEIKKFKSPEAEDYDILSIVMNSDKSRTVYIDDVDAVLYCKLKSHTIETESGRTIIKSTEDRIISAGMSDVHVSKNRFNMPSSIPMNFKALSKYIPFYQETKSDQNE